jgi:hypothetical protein
MNRQAIQIMMKSIHAPSAQFMTALLSNHQEIRNDLRFSA